MAKALQCPACGRKHPVSSLPNAPSFPCEGCGQSLKVPAQFRGLAVPASAVAAPAPPEAAPPLHTEMRGPVREVRTPKRPSTPPTASPPMAPPTARPVAATDGASGVAAPSATFGRRLGTMPLLVLAWVVAVTAGGIITVTLARRTGWLSGQRLVDVFTGTGITRYLRVIAIVPVWAVITTVLVTLMVEGGRWMARARREARAQRATESRFDPSRAASSTGGPGERADNRVRARSAPR